jgi:DNA-binding NarL/FixJ family response regulator
MPTRLTKVITVLIADGHEITRRGIRDILEQAADFQVVGEAQDGEQTQRLVTELQPRVLLLDLIMPNFSAAEFERWVRENYPGTITLVLTAHDRDADLSNMMDAGAAGYLDKKLRAAELRSAIRRAARGENLFTKEQFERARRWRQEVAAKWGSLSDRERELLHMVTGGLENKVIAKTLGITINTVEKHLDNIYKKLGVNSRSEAIHWSVEKITDFRN